MKHVVLAPLVALALLGVAPVPPPSPVPAASAQPGSLSVVCERAPFYVFVAGSDRPTRAHTPEAQVGQRYGLVSGPRSTLSGFDFYETDVAVVEPGFPGAHYWISSACAIPVR